MGWNGAFPCGGGNGSVGLSVEEAIPNYILLNYLTKIKKTPCLQSLINQVTRKESCLMSRIPIYEDMHLLPAQVNFLFTHQDLAPRNLMLEKGWFVVAIF
jgi:hypothetical protein